MLGKTVVENHEWVHHQKDPQESNGAKPYPTTTKRAEPQPYGSAGSSYDIDSLEKELETKLRGMEMAKRCGDPVNQQTLSEAVSLLNKVKSSSRYSNYQQRINALK